MKVTEIKSVSDLLKNDKAVKIITIAGLLIIVFILFFDFFNFSSPTNGESIITSISEKQYTEELEKRLTGILSEIGGAGKVSVMITLENLDENVYSQKETSVTTVKTPKVRGAAVVCDGGNDIVVKGKIIETVSKVLGISTARVCVTN